MFVVFSTIILIASLYTTAHTTSLATDQYLLTNTSSTPTTIQKILDEKKVTRTITLSNNITTAMQGYTYYFITYQPTEFKIIVQGMLIEPNKNYTLSLSNNELEITYSCNFEQGNRQSTQTYLLTLQPNTDHVAITFDWHTQPHIIIHESMLSETNTKEEKQLFSSNTSP